MSAITSDVIALVYIKGEKPMNANERKLEIYNKVVTEKKVFVQELAEEFNVSAMTIRRDLSVLEKQKVLTMVYGGAYYNENNNNDLAYDLSGRKLQEEKLAIAYEASKIVKNGDSIYIGIGTTCYNLTRFLKNERLVIITNSIPVVNNIEEKDKIELIVAPGKFARSAKSFIGVDAIDYLRKFYFDIAFLSPKYIDVSKGATVSDEIEAKMYQSIMKASKKVYLLADHDKFGKTSFVKFADGTDFDAIITDNGIEQSYVEQCNDNLIQLIKAAPIFKGKKNK